MFAVFRLPLFLIGLGLLLYLKSSRSRDGRIDYRGLGQDLEVVATAHEPDWRQEVELWILAEEIGQHFEVEIRI